MFYRYGGVATYNGGGNDDYYSGNSYSQGENTILYYKCKVLCSKL